MGGPFRGGTLLGGSLGFGFGVGAGSTGTLPPAGAPGSGPGVGVGFGELPGLLSGISSSLVGNIHITGFLLLAENYSTTQDLPYFTPIYFLKNTRGCSRAAPYSRRICGKRITSRIDG